ncbi:MAG: agmatine deiminase family protein, partial [Muribaculaceae bacterium]|nr:agmatine deiminase family protein [Muribaculaceae bacterium]
RLAPDDTILYTGTSDRDDMHFESLQAMKNQLTRFRTASGSPFNLIELPLPDPVFDVDTGDRLPATYANYLALAHRIIMPVYGQPLKDNLAAETLKVAFPDREIVTVDCRALVRQHGSLHCVTMQLPAQVITNKIR